MSKRLVDVLDELNDMERANDWVVDKMTILLATIESKNPSIDDFDLRWVKQKIEEYDGGIVPEKEDLVEANIIYKKWNLNKQ